MAKRPRVATPWTQETEEKLVELWQEHVCLYSISSPMYHNRVEKEKSWQDIANALQQPVDEVKTRALSLRTQYSKLLKPRPSGSGNKPLTPRQMWLLRVMDFLKKHIVHRPCETTLSLPSNVLNDAEDQTDDEGTELVEPTDPSTAANPVPSCDSYRSVSPTASEERVASAQASTSTKPVKRKRRSESEVELHKLDLLKRMVEKVEATTDDDLALFGKHLACELRRIKDEANLTRLKRNIINLVYDAQEAERRGASPSQHAPVPSYSFLPMTPTPSPQTQHPHQYAFPHGSPQQAFIRVSGLELPKVAENADIDCDSLHDTKEDVSQVIIQ